MHSTVIAYVRKTGAPIQWMRAVLASYAKTLRISDDTHVSIILAGDDRMKTLHGEYSGEQTITDVLSFPAGEAYGPWKGINESNSLGEIVVCIPQVTRQARAHGVPIRKEIGTMLAHGMLHLLGHDHKYPKDAQKMYALQEKLVYTISY